jgi:hypothetical protein
MPTPGTLIRRRDAPLIRTIAQIALSKATICTRSCRQATSIGPDNWRDVGTILKQNLDLPIKRQSSHRARQQAECLEHPADMVGQSGCHAHELRPRAENCSRTVASERLDVNRPIPAGANDLGQSLGVILIILVDLHFERGARMPRIEANHLEAEIAQFMHNPWRHGAGFDPYPSFVARVSAQGDADLFWKREALAPPYSPAVLVNDANRRHLLRNVQANKMGHR